MASTTDSRILTALKAAGTDYFLSVPCKLLGGMIESLELDNSVLYYPVTREEEGLGMCLGASLAGRLPCILMQDSGLGNCVNAFASTLQYFQTPMVIVISLRGTPGEKVGAQVPMGMMTKDLLALLRIPMLHCHRAEDLDELETFVNHARVCEGPVAVLLDFNLVESAQ